MISSPVMCTEVLKRCVQALALRAKYSESRSAKDTPNSACPLRHPPRFYFEDSRGAVSDMAFGDSACRGMRGNSFFNGAVCQTEQRI